jgi:hypothetical protein
MKFSPVVSSSIRAVAYDESALLMQIEFQDGEVYEYANIQPSTVEQLLKAGSIGQYFNAHIRGVFAGRRLGAQGNGN